MVTLALYEKLTIEQTLLISLICMVIVFGMLALLWGVVSLIKLLPNKKETAQPEEEYVPTQSTNKSMKMEDIKDDDMMVAALVASIDYHNEIKKDVRVVSVKEL